MNLFDEFFSMASMFNKLGIRCALVGLAFHGRPRFTRDVDFFKTLHSTLVPRTAEFNGGLYYIVKEIAFHIQKGVNNGRSK